jgi:hypothetical protein
MPEQPFGFRRAHHFRLMAVCPASVPVIFQLCFRPAELASSKRTLSAPAAAQDPLWIAARFFSGALG